MFYEPLLLGPEIFSHIAPGCMTTTGDHQNFNIGLCSSTQHWMEESIGRNIGDDGAITTHAPYFTPGISFPDPLYRVYDTLLYFSENYIQNLAPSSTATPHIFLPPPSINRNWNRGPVSSPSVRSLIWVLTILFSSFFVIPPPLMTFLKETPQPV